MRANERAGLCFLAISYPEPGVRGGGERPAFFVRRHPRGAAEPTRRVVFGSCAIYREQGSRRRRMEAFCGNGLQRLRNLRSP
jgi:hypothetical protein